MGMNIWSYRPELVTISLIFVISAQDAVRECKRTIRSLYLSDSIEPLGFTIGAMSY